MTTEKGRLVPERVISRDEEGKGWGRRGGKIYIRPTMEGLVTRVVVNQSVRPDISLSVLGRIKGNTSPDTRIHNQPSTSGEVHLDGHTYQTM